jgi:xanthine dehydrogenase accessory factor
LPQTAQNLTSAVTGPALALNRPETGLGKSLSTFWRYGSGNRPGERFSVVLGTNEIASAVAVHLHCSGYGVVLSHDPHPPVIRREMAFHDVLFGDAAEVDGVASMRADEGMQIFRALWNPDGVVVTCLGLLDLLALRTVDVLVDARMQKRQVTPDLRGLAKLTVGLGPGFSANTNCDVAIETRPAKNGTIVHRGWTDQADGIASTLGGAGSERFVYAPTQGRWHTPVEIGTRVFKDFLLGHLSGTPVRAPRDGILRGIVRDGSEVPAGVKLLEIDPRGRHAQWTGIDQRGRTIAQATMNALRIHALHTARVDTPDLPYLM